MIVCSSIISKIIIQTDDSKLLAAYKNFLNQKKAEEVKKQDDQLKQQQDAKLS